MQFLAIVANMRFHDVLDIIFLTVVRIEPTEFIFEFRKKEQKSAEQIKSLLSPPCGKDTGYQVIKSPPFVKGIKPS
jgi:hypothetical protein